MFSFLPGFILFPISFSLYCLNVAICGAPIIVGGLLKLLIPISGFHRALSYPMHAFYRLWTIINFLIIRATNKMQWQLSGANDLDKKSWYLIIANHQSWLDILVLSQLAMFRISAPKFFLKEQLRWVPFVGMACWALNMPFMKRYSSAFIKKYPHLKGQDIETTRRSCEKFRVEPTTIVNFVEGTRFTTAKQKQSKFKHLLTPKAGGIAFTLAAMGDQFDKILNVTITYPDNPNNVIWDLFTGRLKRIVISVEQLEVTEEVTGDYFNDESYKVRFQQWLNEKWLQKDKLIDQLLGQ